MSDEKAAESKDFAENEKKEAAPPNKKAGAAPNKGVVWPPQSKRR